MSGKFVLEAIGGLGNRMRALDSAIAFCRQFDKELHLVWPYFKGLNCPFEMLFEKLDIIESISSPSEFSTNPVLANLKVSYRKIIRIGYPFQYSKYLCKKKVYQLEKMKFPFEKLKVYENLRIQTDLRFYNNRNRYEELKPIKKLQEVIDGYKTKFLDKPVVGIHIRRTDHIWAIENSPTGRFIEEMQAELLIDPRTIFFLATDSEEERHELEKEFGEKIISRNFQELGRDSEEGVQNALIDMYILANTRKIIGSYLSTFSFVASEIKNIPLITINEKISKSQFILE